VGDYYRASGIILNALKTLASPDRPDHIESAPQARLKWMDALAKEPIELVRNLKVTALVQSSSDPHPGSPAESQVLRYVVGPASVFRRGSNSEAFVSILSRINTGSSLIRVGSITS
jgi:hypothetical protein